MFDEKARAVVQEPVIVRVTTLQPDGYPHTVPVWFLMDGDDVLIFTGAGSKKVKNIRENPKGSVAIGGDPVDSPTYLVQGHFQIEDDPDHEVTAKITHHYEPPERAEEWLKSWEGSHHVILRLKPTKVIRVYG